MLPFFLNHYCHLSILITIRIAQKWICIVVQTAFRKLISTTVFVRVIKIHIENRQ